MGRWDPGQHDFRGYGPQEASVKSGSVSQQSKPDPSRGAFVWWSQAKATVSHLIMAPLVKWALLVVGYNRACVNSYLSSND